MKIIIEHPETKDRQFFNTLTGLMYFISLRDVPDTGYKLIEHKLSPEEHQLALDILSNGQQAIRWYRSIHGPKPVKRKELLAAIGYLHANQTRVKP